MRGTKRKRREGVWEVRAYLGRDPLTGKPRQVSKTVYGGAKAADEALRDLIEKQAPRADGMGASFGQLLDRWLIECERMDLSPTTMRTYRAQIETTIRPALGKVGLTRLSAKHLDDLYGSMKTAGKTPKTIRNHHAIISAALHQAARWGWVRTNVAEQAKPPRVSQRRVKAPSVDVVRAVIEAAEELHHYSFGNTLLIQLQCHEATRVAGFHAWRKLGRNVRKGEKAIWILAPVTRKLGDDAETEPGADPKARALVAFKPAAVFDIGQTDGEELPEVVTRLHGNDPSGAYGLLRGVAHAIGYTVEEEMLPGSTNGDCTFDLKRIRVEARNDEVQQVKTLAHELAHAMLHEGFKDRALAELEAESVAFIVCDALGINSGDYTFGYVAAWAGGADEAIAGIRAAGSRIQRTADDIIGRLEAAPAASEQAA